MMNNSLYGNYRTRKFSEIFPKVEEFVAEYAATPLNVISQTDATVLYYLLYGHYGNSSIASSDENQFKFKLFSIIFEYGPTWSKRLEIQKQVRELTEEDLIAGGRAIYNHASNPETAPSTSSLEELNYIDNQSTTNYKKSKVEGYALLMGLLETDVSAEFINKFKKLFITVVEPEYPLWYAMEEENYGISSDN